MKVMTNNTNGEKSKSIKCGCCFKANAVLSDYRRRNGALRKIPVCARCFNLSDLNFWRIYLRSNNEKNSNEKGA